MGNMEYFNRFYNPPSATMQNQAYQQQQQGGSGGAYGAIGMGFGMLGGAWGGRYLGKKILSVFDGPSGSQQILLEDGSIVPADMPASEFVTKFRPDAGTPSPVGGSVMNTLPAGVSVAAPIINSAANTVTVPIAMQTMGQAGTTAGSVVGSLPVPSMMAPSVPTATIMPGEIGAQAGAQAGTAAATQGISMTGDVIPIVGTALTAYQIGSGIKNIMDSAYGGVDTKRREKETIAALMARSIDPAWQSRVNLLHERDLTEGLDPALFNGGEYNFNAIRPQLKGSDLINTAGFLKAVGPSSYTPEQEAAIAQAYLDRGLVRSDAGNIEFGGVLPEVNKGIIDAAIAGKAIPDFKLIPGRGLVDVNEHPELLEEARGKRHNLLGGLWSYGQQRRGELPWMYSGTPAVKSVMSEAPVAPAQPGQTSIIGPTSVVPIPPANVSGAAPQIVISVPGSPTELPALRPEDRVTYPWAPV